MSEDYGTAGTPAATFPKAAFDDIEFYYSTVSVKGGIRHTVHEFPHSPGGEVEKMGRRLYVVTFTANMHDIPGSAMEKEYPQAYPSKLRTLREKFDTELTADLMIPTVGKIKAVATSWTQTFDVTKPTGETFMLEFIEDGEFVEPLVDLDASGFAVIALGAELFGLSELAKFKLEQTLGVFQQINDAITAVQGVLGQADAYSRLVEGKIQAVVNLCAFADSSLTELQDPTNHLVVSAMKDLWLASQELAENVIESRVAIRVWTTPVQMTVGQIAANRYGDAERGVDILQLNAFDDALAIPAGTVIKYLAA